MKRYGLLVGGVMALILITFGIATWLQIPLLTAPDVVMARVGRGAAAVIALGLLVGDVVLPTPSSIVMFYLGRLFGVAGGTLLSTIGCVGAALLAAAIGRRGGPLLARVVTPAELARADLLLGRWGALAIIVSRPVPILAETVALLAGVSRLSWMRVTVSSLIGSLPAAWAYAWAGAHSQDVTSVESISIFAGVLLLAGLTWAIGRRLMVPPAAEVAAAVAAAVAAEAAAEVAAEAAAVEAPTDAPTKDAPRP